MNDWSGCTVVCAASGPSLTSEDLEAVRGRARVIVVNATFRMAPWADVLYAADESFWRVYIREIERVFAGQRWSCSRSTLKPYRTQIVPTVNAYGFSREPGTITKGGNSGYQALHLAALWGPRRIVLLGYDMQRTGGMHHWHGVHDGGLPSGRNFSYWIAQFAHLAKDLQARGIEVINCTRETALQAFPRRSLESVFAPG